MIFALVHAGLGWLLAALAALALRRRSADARCWAWRLGLLKGPLALLLAVPIVIASPLPSGGEEGPPKETTQKQSKESPLASSPRWMGVRGPAVGQVPSSSVVPVPAVALDRSARADKTYRPDLGTSKPSKLPGVPTSLRPSSSPPPSFPFPLVYGLGVAAVLFLRLAQSRRPHRAMPRVVGVLRPRVVLPDGLDPRAAALALAHEEAHVRRRDPQWSFVADLVCAALWFAPPVWLCARALRRESEAACDAAALEATGASPAVYARLLLAFAGPAPANALGGPARRLARRILMLDKPIKPLSRPLATVLAALALAALLPWRAVAAPAHPADRPATGPLKGWGAGLPATRLPLHTAASTLLQEPGMKARVGWTAAQDAEVQRASDRSEATLNAYRAELVRRQKTQTLREAFAWNNRERGKMFARVESAYGPFPWTAKQERTLKSLALARFGSAVWLDPEIANRLRLTSAQRNAIAREDETIAHFSYGSGEPGPLVRPVPAMPKAIAARLKALEARYVEAPPARRQALNIEMSKLGASYQSVYRGQNPKTWKADRDRQLARSWAMRAAADHRLRALLSDDQRRTLDTLESDPAAWSTPIAHMVIFTPDLSVDGKSLDAMPDPQTPGVPLRTIHDSDGTTTRIFRTARSHSPRVVYEYRLETHYRLDPHDYSETLAQSVSIRTDARGVTSSRLLRPRSMQVQPVSTRTNAKPNGHPSNAPSERTNSALSRWSGLTIDGPPPGNEPSNVPIGAKNDPDGSTWTVYRSSQSTPYTYTLEHTYRVPPTKPQMLDYRSGEATARLRSQLVGSRPITPPATLTVGGSTWTIHPPVPKRPVFPTSVGPLAHYAPGYGPGTKPYAEAQRRLANAKPTPPRPLRWTEESVRRLLHLNDGKGLDYKPDPDHPGTEIAVVPDEEGIVTGYRILRHPDGDKGFIYEVKAIRRIVSHASTP